MLIGKGSADRFLSEAEVRQVFEEGLAQVEARGKRVLVIIPDGTRSGPIPLCFRLFTELLEGVAAKLDFLVALGTHAPMDEERLLKLVGITAEERAGRCARVGISNHDWQGDLRCVGTIPAARIAEITGGLLRQDVDVQVNPCLFDYDRVIICGPVFPHEAAGFSGGNKYFFPGVSGPNVINFLHWTSALATNLGVIGVRDNPVRPIIDTAASYIRLPKWCFAMVVKGHDDLAGLYFGTPEEAQPAAADLSAKVNIVYRKHPYHTALSIMPEMYDDLWTAGKGMYKVEPVVADGGTLVIYAPHVDEVAYTHGRLLDRVGYHVRDYFVKEWERVRDVPGVVLGHSTLVKGSGTYENGVERPRVNVVLATGIPRERCERINLGYRDPATLHLDEWMGREEEGILVVPRAGEVLHRLRSA